MGKKAVGTFMKLTFNLVICLVSLITMAGYFVPYADPAVYPSMPFLGLAIPALLILCALFIIWLIFNSYGCCSPFWRSQRTTGI